MSSKQCGDSDFRRIWDDPDVLQTASDVSWGPWPLRTQTSPDVTPGLWCQTYFECSAGMIPTEFHILQRGNMLKPPTRFPLSLADDQTDGSDLDSLDGQIQQNKMCTFDGLKTGWNPGDSPAWNRWRWEPHGTPDEAQRVIEGDHGKGGCKGDRWEVGGREPAAEKWEHQGWNLQPCSSSKNVDKSSKMMLHGFERKWEIHDEMRIQSGRGLQLSWQIRRLVTKHPLVDGFGYFAFCSFSS